MAILVLNAGSSSLKFRLFDVSDPGSAPQPLGGGQIEWGASGAGAALDWDLAGAAPDLRLEEGERAVAIGRLVGHLASGEGAIEAVGHRVVHGGAAFSGSVRVDAAVLDEIARLVPLAPLHNPPALDAIEAVAAALAQVPQVAVFDTAFYSSLPAAAHIYPVPYAWYEEWGVRRFGFHGISHAYCAGRAADLLGRQDDAFGLVCCHLGNGCSATAVRGGRAVAHTMGFTPLEGLMMGTRSGSVDPGILLYVQQRHGLDAAAMDRALNRESGLLGVSGVAADYRAVEAAARSGHERARLALEIYARRVQSAIGALTAEMGGADALVFTGGVGENAAELRAQVCRNLGYIGVELDEEANRRAQADVDVAAAGGKVRVLVVHTEEEGLIARETVRVLGQ